MIRRLWHRLFGSPAEDKVEIRPNAFYIETEARGPFLNSDGIMEVSRREQTFIYTPVEPGSIADPFTVMNLTDPESVVIKIDYFIYEKQFDRARAEMPDLYEAVRKLVLFRETMKDDG